MRQIFTRGKNVFSFVSDLPIWNFGCAPTSQASHWTVPHRRHSDPSQHCHLAVSCQKVAHAPNDYAKQNNCPNAKDKKNKKKSLTHPFGILLEGVVVSNPKGLTARSTLGGRSGGACPYRPSFCVTSGIPKFLLKCPCKLLACRLCWKSAGFCCGEYKPLFVYGFCCSIADGRSWFDRVFGWVSGCWFEKPYLVS